MGKVRTHYDNLKVARNAPIEVIRAAYKSLCQMYHPDKNPNNPNAAKVMAIINQAYDTLSDPKKRIEHDNWIREQETIPSQENSTPHPEHEKKPDITLPTSGFFIFNELPPDIQERILNRISGKNTKQLRLKLNGITYNYLWSIALLGWFIYLFIAASEYKWNEEANYLHGGITFFVAALLAKNVESIYSWYTTPLRSFLIISPLYIIKTDLDKLWFWPIWTISNLKATHKYRNGSYQETSLSIFFNEKEEQFQISPESAYDALIDALKTFDLKFRESIKLGNFNYLIENDDFLGQKTFKEESIKTRKNLSKAVFLTYAPIFIASLSAYGIAFSINSNNPQEPYETSSYTHNSTSPRNISARNSDYVRPLTAPNGSNWPSQADYINGFEKLHTDGLSIVTIDNTQNNSDVFVKVVALNGKEAYPIRVFYIPSYGKFTVNNIRAGSYDVRYRDLDSGMLSRSETFQLDEYPTADSIQYSNITMTLYKIRNGNMRTYNITESEF